MYNGEMDKPLGFLSKGFLPFWRGIPGGLKVIEPEHMPKRVGPVKFIKLGYRPFKMPGLKKPIYLTQYLMVP